MAIEEFRPQRKLLAGRIEELLDAHRPSKVLTSMPGNGVRSPHPDRGRRRQHLPDRRIPRRLRRTRPRDPQLRLLDPRRTALQKRKQAAQTGFLPLRVRRPRRRPRPGPTATRRSPRAKHHTQALLCLARRMADVLFAMLRVATCPSPRSGRGRPASPSPRHPGHARPAATPSSQGRRSTSHTPTADQPPHHAARLTEPPHPYFP